MREIVFLIINDHLIKVIIVTLICFLHSLIIEVKDAKTKNSLLKNYTKIQYPKSNSNQSNIILLLQCKTQVK